MYTREAINDLYRRAAASIDISDEMFDAAAKAYTELGQWIDQKTPAYRISIYPQGSFALGTVVRPINNKDDYDLDLVCQFAQSYYLTARQLKVDVVKPLLMQYKKLNGDIIEKRRCWHVNYEEIPNFHMDVVPSYADGPIIQITNHDEEHDRYEYMGSNPAGYVKWFFDRCAKQHTRLYETYVKEHHLVVAQADVEKIKRHKVKTPLQRAIQLLKRHRDIMFQNRDVHEKPVSIIITTLAAQLYQEEDNVFDALKNILGNAREYIEDNMREGKYHIGNPSFDGENFADKWDEHKERARAFFEWIDVAYADFASDALLNYSKVDMARNINNALGTDTGLRIFSAMALEDRNAIKGGVLKVNPTTGSLSTHGSIPVPPNHHHGS